MAEHSGQSGRGAANGQSGPGEQAAQMQREKGAQQERGPARAYAEMLLRQHPWLSGELAEGEYPVELSYRKPETLLGLSLAFIGVFVLLDTLPNLAAFGGVPTGLLVALAGAAALWGGVWTLWLAGRSYVLVTSERVVCRGTDLFGRPGKKTSIPRGEIKHAAFLKSTVMYRAKRADGSILLTLNNKKTYLLPNLRDAEKILGAIQQTSSGARA